ncbi:MAG: hypothetical protein LBC80_04625 [Treponema sp.]|jgi:hypothetical protein|nr:hypothetical protein [Treponema sp.]
MVYRKFLCILIFFSILSHLYAQGRDAGSHPYVIRGEVHVELEPIYAGQIDREYPLDIPTAGRRGLQEIALFFSGMIYGWSFFYEIGERARQIEEVLELEALGTIPDGDPALRVTDTSIRGSQLVIWADYHLSSVQQSRMQIWRSGNVRSAQGIGFGPTYLGEYTSWLAIRKLALEDAARAAIRAILQNSERNRPKEASGFISLASFPRFFIQGGRWVVSARFRVQVNEIVPFAVH